MRRALFLAPALFVLCVGALAQSAATPQPPVRYHDGDNPAWAAPGFDDSAWPVAQQGRWPAPNFYSNGFIWVRFHISVPAGAADPLAIRQVSPNWPSAEEIFVNGLSVAKDGQLPPSPVVWISRRTTVFDLEPDVLQSGTAEAGATVVVALRAWYQPIRRRQVATGSAGFEINQSKTLHAEERGDRAVAALAETPNIALNLLLGLVGFGLLLLWRRSARRELLWCGAFLMTYALPAVQQTVTNLLFLPVASRSFEIWFYLFQIVQMWITVEFLWTIFALRSKVWKWSAIAALVIFNAGGMVYRLTNQSSPFLAGCFATMIATVMAFNLLTLAVELRVLFAGRSNRAVAATLAIIPVASSLGIFGFGRGIQIGPVTVDLFDLGFLLSGFALAAMLTRRAWKAMRAGDELRAEFEAAQELQQQLVTAPPQVPGFHIESAYTPARHVGGDFFRVIPQEDAVLVVIGDVSGKGLRAAMTVSSVFGALRAVHSTAPGEILADLNRSLLGNAGGGFTTCLCARVAPDGSVTLANAGHLAPYRNGEEIDLESGLPLGLIADASYSEATVKLQPADTITLLTDGVVEARNSAGELFGFDRTRAISGQPAEKIAQTAQRFGQEDDITVLTLTLAPVEVAHA